MEQKENYNFRIPASLSGEFGKIAKRHGHMQKWMVCAAAMLRLMALPEDEQDALIRECGKADVDNTMSKLIASAKTASGKGGLWPQRPAKLGKQGNAQAKSSESAAGSRAT